MNDIDDYLKASTPEERVAALAWGVEHLYAFSDEHEKARTLRILASAEQAAGPEGWRSIAYHWLEQSRHP